MYARVPQAMAQFVLKIEKLSHIMGPTPILEMARAYGLRPRLWLLLLMSFNSFTYSTCQPVREAENREFPVFHSGVIVKFGWLVRNVFGVVCHDIVNRRVINCHVRDDSTEYITEFFLGINT